MARVHTRFQYLVELWSQLSAESELPQLDRWLSLRFKTMPQLGSRDRHWYRQLIFATVRCAEFAAVAASWNGDSDPIADATLPDAQASWERLRKIPAKLLLETAITTLAARGTLASVAGDDAAALQELVATTSGARVSKLDQALAARDKLAARCLQAGVPSFFAAHLQTRMQASPEFDACAFLGALDQRPPIWLRVYDPQRTPHIIRDLERLQLTATAYGNSAISVHSQRGLPPLPPALAKQIEIQDLASQELGSHVAACPGELIWDACAGGGGKTLQLAAAVGNKGKVYASDIRSYKLTELQRRAQRAGLNNITLLPGAAGQIQTLPAAVQQRGGFDCILVDAPCTGAGTWRRSPDARFRISATKLQDLQELQLSILRDVSRHLRPGGRLVYATCSWLVAENEAILRDFQQIQPGWILQHSRLLGSPWLDSDTMYVASLRRMSNEARP